jgi:hypothetical protein
MNWVNFENKTFGGDNLWEESWMMKKKLSESREKERIYI